MPAAAEEERLTRNYRPLKVTELEQAAPSAEGGTRSAISSAWRSQAAPSTGADNRRSSSPVLARSTVGNATAWDQVAARDALFAVLGNSLASGLSDPSVQAPAALAGNPAFASAAVAPIGLAAWESEGGVLLSDTITAQVDSQLAGGQRTSGPEWALVFTPLMGPSRGRERQQPTIVVADSDEKSRDAITVKLVHEGFLVLPVGSGRDALNVARIPLSPIDVVLLDLHLPDVSAVQVVRRLQQLYLKMPAVVCTGTTGPRERQQLSLLGVKGYLPKPVELDSLVATIRTLVRSR